MPGLNCYYLPILQIDTDIRSKSPMSAWTSGQCSLEK